MRDQTCIWTNVLFPSKEPCIGLGIFETEAILALLEMEWNEEYQSWLPSLRFLWVFSLCFSNLLLRSRNSQKGKFPYLPLIEDPEKGHPWHHEQCIGTCLSSFHLDLQLGVPFSSCIVLPPPLMLHNPELAPPVPFGCVLCQLIARFPPTPAPLCQGKELARAGTHFPSL